MSSDVVGWASSIILVITIGKQVHKQWQEGKSEGVSKWLFIGQVVASLGFTIYSLLVKNWVFVVTNAVMLCNGLLGFFILRRNRKAGGVSESRERSRPPLGVQTAAGTHRP
jgi:uncharacterized protein with PQ loop repeat